MHFGIVGARMGSFAKLAGDEQKWAGTAEFDLQVSPAHLGPSFHQLDRAKDKNFWSVH